MPKDEKKYEIKPINTKIEFVYNENKKCFELIVKGADKISELYLKMNESGSGAHGVNIQSIFSQIRHLNKLLSFMKMDFDVKEYDK
jgi:hypothetical protein